MYSHSLSTSTLVPASHATHFRHPPVSDVATVAAVAALCGCAHIPGGFATVSCWCECCASTCTHEGLCTSATRAAAAVAEAQLEAQAWASEVEHEGPCEAALVVVGRQDARACVAQVEERAGAFRACERRRHMRSPRSHPRLFFRQARASQSASAASLGVLPRHERVV